jgi:hypothetical protein
MSADLLEYCNKVTIEGGNIGLDGAAKQFLSNPENIEYLVFLIKMIHKYYVPENEDGSFEEFKGFFRETFNHNGVEYDSHIQFFLNNEKDREIKFPFSLIVRFTKYAYHVKDNEYYLYDVCLSDTVTVEKKEQFTLVEQNRIQTNQSNRV